jgi:predicted membrane-bound dolichyl-phosphate-mannose-protein mannosyltransferase
LKANLEDVVILDRIKRNFNKLMKFSRYFISKIETEKDFEEFLVGFERILKELEIEKLYNNTTIKDIHNFDKLNLFQQFFYISIPIYNSGKVPNFIK